MRATTLPFLRPFRAGDAPALARLAGDRAIADTMISVPHPLDPVAATALLARYAAEEAGGTARHLAVCWDDGADAAGPGPADAVAARHGDAPLVGAVSLRHLDAEHRQGELSFWIGRPWWGRGLAPAAAAAALDLAFADPPVGLGLDRVEAYHMTRNAGSERVLARLGFRQEGVLRQRVWKWGRPEDVMVHALLRADHHPSAAAVGPPRWSGTLVTRPALVDASAPPDPSSTAGAVVLTVFGVPVTLAPSPGVFVPTPHGLFYAGAARVAPGERVIDIGTGSGVLAIAAARLGARVVATDVDPRATAAARRNAALNGVDVECRTGALFADAAGPFDVVLANLPNEIVAPAHLAALPPEDARTFAGGPAGNDALLALLDAAPAYLHAGSRLYLGVHALTDYHATLRAALARYAVRLVAFAPLPAKPYVTEHLDFYRALDAAGVVRLFRDADGGWQSWGYVYELTPLGAGPA